MSIKENDAFRVKPDLINPHSFTQAMFKGFELVVVEQLQTDKSGFDYVRLELLRKGRAPRFLRFTHAEFISVILPILEVKE